jgi:hypothetical protein
MDTSSSRRGPTRVGQSRSRAVGRALTVALSLFACPRVIGFPDSQDPITAQPPLIRPGRALCTLPLITNAACNSYDLVVQQAYTPPGPECAGTIYKVTRVDMVPSGLGKS